MIPKPSNWNEVKAVTGGGQRPPAGGYRCRIQAVNYTTSRKGDPMLDIYYDIEGGDYEGYFLSLYNRNLQQGYGDKWPNSGTIHQLTDGDFMGRFKGLLETIEKCNPGYKWDWDEKKLAGKLIGIILREEEYEANDGSVKTRISYYVARELDGIEDAPVPSVKKLGGNGYGNQRQGGFAGAPAQGDFPPPIPDEEIPF